MIKNRLLCVAEGLKILAPYCGPMDIMADHDVVGAAPNTKEQISEEDRKKLVDLGWFYSEHQDSWIHYV